MTPEELKKTYSSLSTSQLLEIVDSKFEYTELAVSIALAELATRNISEEEIKDYKHEQIEKVDSFIKKNIYEDLNIFQKIWFYFMWIPVINFITKMNFRDAGAVLKIKQANYYSWCGFIFCAASAIIAISFDPLNEWLIYLFWILGFVITTAFDETVNRKRQIEKLEAMFEKSKVIEEI